MRIQTLCHIQSNNSLRKLHALIVRSLSGVPLRTHSKLFLSETLHLVLPLSQKQFLHISYTNVMAMSPSP